jgi:hypothetical protein
MATAKVGEFLEDRFARSRSSSWANIGRTAFLTSEIVRRIEASHEPIPRSPFLDRFRFAD